jgi:hypothetical protein
MMEIIGGGMQEPVSPCLQSSFPTIRWKLSGNIPKNKGNNSLPLAE